MAKAAFQSPIIWPLREPSVATRAPLCSLEGLQGTSQCSIHRFMVMLPTYQAYLMKWDTYHTIPPIPHFPDQSFEVGFSCQPFASPFNKHSFTFLLSHSLIKHSSIYLIEKATDRTTNRQFCDPSQYQVLYSDDLPHWLGAQALQSNACIQIPHLLLMYDQGQILSLSGLCLFLL